MQVYGKTPENQIEKKTPSSDSKHEAISVQFSAI